MNIPITTIDRALVNGGVTDGTRTVFYKDVESVTVETTSRRPFRKKFSAFVSESIGSLASIGGIVILLFFLFLPRTSGKEFFPEFFGFVSLLAIAACAFTVKMCSRTYFESVLRIATRSGVTNLVYTRSWRNPEEIGTAIAEILNERRGQAPSPETTDRSYELYIDRDYKETPFFQIENDQLKIYCVCGYTHEWGEVALTLEAEIDLTDVVSVDCLDKSGRYSNGFRGDSILGKLFQNSDSGMQWDLVFTFRSGQKVTHYVRGSVFQKQFESLIPINYWEYRGLMEGLAEEVSTYLKSR